MSQNVQTPNPTHTPYLQIATATLPVLQELLPLTPKTGDVLPHVLTIPLINSLLTSTDALQLALLDSGLIRKPSPASPTALLQRTPSKTTQLEQEFAYRCALLPTSLDKLSTTHAFKLVQTALMVKFTILPML